MRIAPILGSATAIYKRRGVRGSRTWILSLQEPRRRRHQRSRQHHDALELLPQDGRSGRVLCLTHAPNARPDPPDL